MVVVDGVHLRLTELVAEMMGEARGGSAPRSHASFLALGGTEAQAAELARMVNALFGLDLPGDIILRSPTPDALARMIETEWYEGGGTAVALLDLVGAIADAD